MRTNHPCRSLQIRNIDNQWWAHRYIFIDIFLTYANFLLDPEDKDKSYPVIIEEPPPPHFAYLRSWQLLANEIINCKGPSCLRPSAATTRVRKPKSRQATPISSSIVVNNDSLTFTIVRQLLFQLKYLLYALQRQSSFQNHR